MRALVQRVLKASVSINGEIYSKIDKGLLVFLGVGQDDTEKDLNYLSEKVVGLRIFEDSEGKMNLSLKDIDGELMIISQFTLYGEMKSGKRPSFSKAAKAEMGEFYYSEFVRKCGESIDDIKTGIFGEDMKIELINDGPVTLLIDSNKA